MLGKDADTLTGNHGHLLYPLHCLLPCQPLAQNKLLLIYYPDRKA